MRSEQIADMINRQRLHLRKDGQPESAKQVFYVDPFFGLFGQTNKFKTFEVVHYRRYIKTATRGTFIPL